MLWIVLLLLLAVIVGVVVVGMRLASQQQPETDPLMTRLAEIAEAGRVTSLEEVELQQPFSERVLVPILRRIGEFSLRFTPQKALQDVELQLEMAGRPYRMDATTFLALRLILPAVFGGFFILIYSLAPVPPPLSRRLLMIFLAAFVGIYFPQLWLRSQINRRQRDIRKSLPDALDLLTICVEAGLGFEAALSKVSEKWQTALSFEFERVIKEVQLGKQRRDALRSMSLRVGIPEMTSFVAAVIQSETLGVSLAKVLRIQSEQMRLRRRQRAEEEANKAPVKMVIPMVFLIFPSIFIILLTPAAIQIMNAFRGIF